MALEDRTGTGLPRLLTTREIADLLRVKERKVYDMAAAGEIPHRRLTGKLLFPEAEISAWLSGGQGTRPAVVGGSHDPLLDWAVRESGCGLSVLFDGSQDGLRRFQAGEVACAGIHIPEAEGWNLNSVDAAELSGAVLIAWAARNQGLMLRKPKAENVCNLGDIEGRRLALRQEGAGARALFDKLSEEAGLSVPADSIVVRTEHEAAQAVASGDADAALGLQAAAQAFGLGFVHLATERFDLLLDRRAYFTGPFQALLSFVGSDVFNEKAARLGGYNVDDLGSVRWLSR